MRRTSTPTATSSATVTPTHTQTPTPTPTAPPGVVVSQIFPSIGSAAGGTSVVLEGSGFSGGVNTVLFGDTPATDVIVLDDRKISCAAPVGSAGSEVGITVMNDRGTGSLDGAYRYGGSGAATALSVDLSGQPTVSLDSQIGTTTVVLDYLIRDSNGIPVDESNVNVTMFVNGIQLGSGQFNESVLDRNSQELDFSVDVTMVLDASYSLQRFNPPQFTPMLAGAQSLVDGGTQIWQTRRGTFSSNVVWFDELISHPDPNFLKTFRIANIPAPKAGNFTKLYAAISYALNLSDTQYHQGIAAGPRDNHVIVVFTDGQDNLSSFDNAGVELQGHLKNGNPYPRIGWKATDLKAVLAEIASSPMYPEHLAVHTIALGVSCDRAPAGAACFDGPALQQIAQVGFGQQLVSPGNAIALFNQIRKEFTTLQSSGAKMALAPGDYEFRLVVQRKDRTAMGEVSFAFRVTESGAQFLAFQ